MPPPTQRTRSLSPRMASRSRTCRSQTTSCARARARASCACSLAAAPRCATWARSSRRLTTSSSPRPTTRPMRPHATPCARTQTPCAHGSRGSASSRPRRTSSRSRRRAQRRRTLVRSPPRQRSAPPRSQARPSGAIRKRSRLAPCTFPPSRTRRPLRSPRTRTRGASRCATRRCAWRTPRPWTASSARCAPASSCCSGGPRPSASLATGTLPTPTSSAQPHLRHQTMTSLRSCGP
mmetsp:Transcript_5008/g.12908  ORF Transcript_5008/g.12908 Transcript_5008/m.12908 type:complete len:236 (+) Transcript_5008:1180-1887(+)